MHVGLQMTNWTQFGTVVVCPQNHNLLSLLRLPPNLDAYVDDFTLLHQRILRTDVFHLNLMKFVMTQKKVNGCQDNTE
jgi:hypothetical protein